MKNLLLITLFLMPFLGISQTTKPIEGFLGIKFGTSQADVIAAMKAKGCTPSDGGDSKKLVFQTDIKLGPRSAIQLTVFFFNDQVFDARFYFKADQEPQSVEYYNSLVSDISDVYGKGAATKTFKSPYENGDGHEIIALEGGYANFATLWKADNNNAIAVSIRPLKEDELYIILDYVDLTIQKENDEKEKAAY